MKVSKIAVIVGMEKSNSSAKRLIKNGGLHILTREGWYTIIDQDAEVIICDNKFLIIENVVEGNKDVQMRS